MADFAIGQKVAIYQSYYSGGTFNEATIERDTKLYWVANGRKFRKSDGVEPGSGTWTRSYYLLPLSDTRITETRIANQKSSAYGRVIRAEDALRKDRENLELIEALKQALDAYADVLSA